ncbi:MAG: LysM peptidoglycan-binding domain-containing M23 family metallopeptidase [Treponema sp.]|nr:LysM peptidoglycan-binding domain-containing M23 family metallopeptidase [Treponema sp.]
MGGEETVHVVEKGETIYSIARSYGIKPEVLMDYNRIADPSRLQIGKGLKIPRNDGFIEHRVLKNETLYGIARKNGVSLDALREANGFGPEYVLKEGERIRIPQTGADQIDEDGVAGLGKSITGNSGVVVNSASTTLTGNTGTVKAALDGQKNSGETQVLGSAGGVPLTDPRSTALKTVDVSLRWPVNPKEIVYMTGKLSGVVVEGEQAESVRSLIQGTVVSAGPYRGFGRVAIVQVAGGYLYVYGGCESLSVKEGDRVGSGTELGKLGIDAVSLKPQLFFLVYRNNNPIDPSKAPRA